MRRWARSFARGARGASGAWGATPAPQPTAAAAPTFRLGEGLLGQAALQSEISVVHDVPEGHLPLRSGLGQSAPKQLVFLPLAQLGRVIGVLELGCIAPWSASQTELLTAVRETIVIALEVARARTALRALLGETQSQARRLADQEEELRASNEELHSQQ